MANNNHSRRKTRKRTRSIRTGRENIRHDDRDVPDGLPAPAQPEPDTLALQIKLAGLHSSYGRKAEQPLERLQAKRRAKKTPAPALDHKADTRAS